MRSRLLSLFAVLCSSIVTLPAGQPDADVRIRRERSDTVYEPAMPWSQLAPIRAADGLMSLSLVVNDNDGNGREGWIEWGSGVAGAKDPALFRAAELTGGTP